MLAPLIDPILLDSLVGSLADRGFCVAPDAVDPVMVDLLLGAARAREQEDGLAEAGIGRNEDLLRDTRIRKVNAAWLDGSCEADAAMLAVAEQIRQAINRQLFLGLFEFEAQYLVYPPGGFYARHVDSLAGARNRLVSLVLYINRNWEPVHGGELDIWSGPDDPGPPVATVEPRAGTILLMLSEQIPHRVRTANSVRRVVAGWFRVNGSVAGRVDPPH